VILGEDSSIFSNEFTPKLQQVLHRLVRDPGGHRVGRQLKIIAICQSGTVTNCFSKRLVCYTTKGPRRLVLCAYRERPVNAAAFHSMRILSPLGHGRRHCDVAERSPRRSTSHERRYLAADKLNATFLISS